MTAREDTTKDPAAKTAALSLLRRGLVTQSEAARMAGVSRQLVRKWAKGIPIDKNRDAVLAKLWRKEMAKGRSVEGP